MFGLPSVPSVRPHDVDPDAFVLDVREQDEWDAGHLPAALHVPLHELPRRLDEVPADREVLVVCRVGGRSAQAVAWLAAQGRDAVNVEGGLEAWSAVHGGLRRPERRDPRDEVFVDKRPWGQFQQLTLNLPTTVKILTVNPGCRLSLQRHEGRDEFWTVLDVPLVVQVGEEQRTVQPGEQVWIPRRVTHRVGNVGEAPGRILEIAYGHFDENDIERLEDDYCR